MSLIPHNLIREIETRSLNAWPAVHTKQVEGWVFRAAFGFSKRANSVTPISPRVEVTEIKSRMGEFYGEKELPVIVKITPLAPLHTDQQCEAFGYRLVDPSIVMIANISSKTWSTSGELSISTKATERWKRGFQTCKGLSTLDAENHNTMLDMIKSQSAFVSIKDETDRDVAFGYAVSEKGMVGLFDIFVDKDKRGKGYAKSVVAGLMNWSRDIGAQTVYLQVTKGNQAARTLYTTFGFREVYRYHYRQEMPLEG